MSVGNYIYSYRSKSLQGVYLISIKNPSAEVVPLAYMKEGQTKTNHFYTVPANKSVLLQLESDFEFLFPKDLDIEITQIDEYCSFYFKELQVNDIPEFPKPPLTDLSSVEISDGVELESFPGIEAVHKPFNVPYLNNHSQTGDNGFYTNFTTNENVVWEIPSLKESNGFELNIAFRGSDGSSDLGVLVGSDYQSLDPSNLDEDPYGAVNTVTKGQLAIMFGFGTGYLCDKQDNNKLVGTLGANAWDLLEMYIKFEPEFHRISMKIRNLTAGGGWTGLTTDNSFYVNGDVLIYLRSYNGGNSLLTDFNYSLL